MKFSNLCVTIFSLFLLNACGGGGTGSSSTPTIKNNIPTVSISGATEVETNNNLSLMANASDSDGSIASYAWVVESGTLSLSSATTSQVSFIAPDVDKDTVVSLSVTVVDNKGATAKAIQQITIKSKKTSLTITGLVINGDVVPNADITVTIGDLAFNTKANASGKYTISLPVDSAHTNIPVVIKAVSNTNAALQLVSQLKSFGRLTEQAGEDNILSASENINVNISNVTTAEYALLTRPSSLGTINTIFNDSELDYALNSVGSSEKLRIASFLQLIALNNTFSIPAGNQTTLDFAKNKAAVDAFEVMVNNINPALHLDIKETIAQNPDVTIASVFIGDYIISASAQPLSGAYVTFNADASGKIICNKFTSAFTWTKKGSIITLNFPVPIETGKLEGSVGRWVIKAAELNVYDETPSAKFVVFSLINVLIDKDGQEIFSDYKQTPANLYGVSKATVPDEAIFAGEWIAGTGYEVASYQFNAGHSVEVKKYRVPLDINQSTWSVDAHKLMLKTADNLTEDIYFTSDSGVGYSYVKVTRLPDGLLEFSNGLFIKPQKNLSVKKSDLVGTWLDSNSSSIRVMSSDGLMFADFGASPAYWTTDESNNSWGRKLYKQGYTEYLPSCDVSAGTNPDCNVYDDLNYKVIAVNGNQYYSLNSYTTYTVVGMPRTTYTLVQSTKLPEIKYFTRWITSSGVKVFYQSTPSGIKVWNMSSDKLIISNNSLADEPFFNNTIALSLKNNHVQYVRDNIARELSLISASENGLVVCEYNQGASCVVGTEFLLSNRSPAKISLSVVGAGTIVPANDAAFYPAGLFGNKAAFYVRPDAGSIIKSVTGCDGSLEWDQYRTSEVREACTITVTFSAAP